MKDEEIHEINSIVTGQDCTECKFFKVYTTGIDEYPQCTTIAYCSKGHWENGSPTGDYEANDCNDYEFNINLLTSQI